MSVEQLTALSSTDSIEWKCKTCVGSTKPKRLSFIVPDEDDLEDTAQAESPSQPGISGLGTQQSFIQQVLREIKQEVRSIITDELQRSLKYYSEKIDDFNGKMINYEQNIKILENKSTDVRNNLKNLNLKIESLDNKLLQIEQEQLANKLEICGVEEKEKENVQEDASKIAAVLKQNPQDIIKVYRKRSRGQNQKITKTAIIAVLREGTRNQWLEAAKFTPLTPADVGREGSDKVYLREVLSPATAFLLWKAKEELKPLYAYIWCKNGAVLIRKREKGKVFTVRSESDIATLKEDQETFTKPV